MTTALIGGRLAGSLDAKSVELQSGADVKADISTKDLEMQKGVTIKGHLQVSPSD